MFLLLLSSAAGRGREGDGSGRVKEGYTGDGVVMNDAKLLDSQKSPMTKAGHKKVSILVAWLPKCLQPSTLH